MDEVGQLQLPCVLHWNLDHFVVLESVKVGMGGKVTLTILDPATGRRKLSADQAAECFTGVAVEFSPSAQFTTADQRQKVKVKDLIGHVVGWKRAVIQVVLLAITLEIFAIAAPLFNQFVVDEVIVSGDFQLLNLLVVGFSLLMVTQTAISLARSWFLMRWSMDIGFQWGARLFAHLTKLSGSYFEKRHVGDIVSRFGSINAIQSTLTNLFVETALDGIMAILALAMMLLYSAKLTFIVVIGVLSYLALRLVLYPEFRAASEERLILSSRESSHFLETLRSITALKLFGKEDERRIRWQNLKMDVQNRDVRTQKLGIIFKIGSSSISGFQGLAMFYFGAGLIMANSITVGMLMAFASYASTFSTRVFGLIDTFMSVRMLTMHADRLSDIVLEPVEPVSTYDLNLTNINGEITLRNVSFRYGDGEPWILRDVNLFIPAHQSVALTGPSGCGKSTLCKIILGLIDPSSGDVLIDGIPIKQIGLSQFRSLVGTVMQEDTLLSGSIQDNIAFFDIVPNHDLIRECAIAASIHADIMTMPMGYHTLIGDLGSGISGGQRQRILLARALYKRPKILALDEATSHLDLKNEANLNEALSQMKLTRIMVAHRAETIRSAERVISLVGGCLGEVNVEI